MTKAVTDHFKVVIENFRKNRSEKYKNFVRKLAIVDMDLNLILRNY